MKKKKNKKKTKGFPVGSVVNNLPATRENQVQFQSLKDPLEDEMAIHSSVCAWEFPWTEESDGLCCWVAKSQRRLSMHTHH